ncbi:MAG: hypothetical protein WAK17_10270 [Candidatus Nitrosopolaris sp.]|jgi:hypothetical protein
MTQISSDQTTPESSNKWAEIAGQVIDRVVGKNMSMTYDFQQLTIDMPKAEGPGGKHMGSAQWTLNGRIIITSEIHDKNDHDKK